MRLDQVVRLSPQGACSLGNDILGRALVGHRWCSRWGRQRLRAAALPEIGFSAQISTRHDLQSNRQLRDLLLAARGFDRAEGEFWAFTDGWRAPCSRLERPGLGRRHDHFLIRTKL